jgi:hypothetical protein
VSIVEIRCIVAFRDFRGISAFEKVEGFDDDGGGGEDVSISGHLVR